MEQGSSFFLHAHFLHYKQAQIHTYSRSKMNNDSILKTILGMVAVDEYGANY